MKISEKIVLLQELNNTIALVENSACVSYSEKCFIINTVIKSIGHLLITEVKINGKETE